MTKIEQAIYNLKQAECWFAKYNKDKTNIRKMILEHYIELTRFHVDDVKAHKKREERI